MRLALALLHSISLRARLILKSKLSVVKRKNFWVRHQSPPTNSMNTEDKSEASCVALLWKLLSQPLYGPCRAMHGRHRQKGSFARQLRSEVISVGSKIGNATGTTQIAMCIFNTITMNFILSKFIL